MSVSEKKPRPTTRVAVAGPGALASVLLIGAVAFGASSLRGPSPEATHADQGGAAATPKPSLTITATRSAGAYDAADADPKATAVPKPSDKPDEPKVEEQEEQPKAIETSKADAPKAPDQPKETEKPMPAPTTPTVLALEGWTKETKVKLGWKAYGGEGFEYYKVVRSADGTASWPPGGDDTVVGVIGDRSAAWWADVPPCGTPWTYRVFAVRQGDAGYVTLAATNAVTLSVTCLPEPTPVTVVPLAFQVEATADGIALSWETCTSEHFTAYKVVRSKTNPDPRYPLNDGTELIAAIGDPNQTSFLDGNVAPGETWTYRVVAVMSGSSGHVPIGQTAAMSATAP